MIANTNILFLGFCFIKCKFGLCGLGCFLQCLTQQVPNSDHENMAMTLARTAMLNNDLLCLFPHHESPELFNCVEDSWNCAWIKTARVWPALFYCYSLGSLLLLTKYSPPPQKYLWFTKSLCLLHLAYLPSSRNVQKVQKYIKIKYSSDLFPIKSAIHPCRNVKVFISPKEIKPAVR